MRAALWAPREGVATDDRKGGANYEEVTATGVWRLEGPWVAHQTTLVPAPPAAAGGGTQSLRQGSRLPANPVSSFCYLEVLPCGVTIDGIETAARGKSRVDAHFSPCPPPKAASSSFDLCSRDPCPCPARPSPRPLGDRQSRQTPCCAQPRRQLGFKATWVPWRSAEWPRARRRGRPHRWGAELGAGAANSRACWRLGPHAATAGTKPRLVTVPCRRPRRCV